MSLSPLHSVFPHLVESIYAASLDAARWIDTVEQIRIAAHGSHASLVTLETPPERGGFSISRQSTAADFAEYARYAPKSEWIAGWKRLGQPQDAVLTAEMVAPWETMRKTEIYQEFFRPREMHDSATAVLFNGLDGLHPATILVVSHPEGWGQEKAASTLLQRLMPHLKRALDINRILAERESVRRASLLVLRQLSVAALFVGRDQSPLYLNPAAERLVRTSDGLAISGRKLRALEPADSGRLARLIEQATARTGPVTGGSLRLMRPSGRKPFYITVTPVRPSHALIPDLSEPAAMVTITDPESPDRIPKELLQQRLGLTDAESRVLATLLEGRTPTEAAEHLQLSVKTVRMHLSRLFQKTGTRRQADLLRAGLLSAGILRPSA